MHRHPTLRGGALLIFALLAALLGATLPPGQPAVALATLVATPTAPLVNLTLGGSTNLSIKLTNNAGAAITPAIYEALPDATADGLTRAPRAPDGPRAVALPRQIERIDAGLADELARAPDRRGDFFVYLRDQADLSAAYAIGDWGARGRYVYQTLAGWAEAHQRGLRAQLAARGLAYRPFWIVNAVLVHGTLADAAALAGRDDVALVRANHTAALPPRQGVAATGPDYCSPDQPGTPVCWNIRKIGADRVWRDFGITGRGVVVATIDTGVAYNHPALSASYRGYRGPGSYSHDYNWFDPQGTLAQPTDDNGHGTHTMGTIVGAGDGSTDRPAIGVAPGARWIAAQGCDFYLCSEDDLISSAQWLLAPTTIAGDQPRPDLRPMIVSNSWAGLGGDPWYAGYTAAWRAAGIFPVFAAGNVGGEAQQVCGSIASPGDYADVLAVGATDHDDTIASFSLLGPSADGRLKPDLVAPGTYQSNVQGLLSSEPDGGYQTLQGTSMATPHVSGLVALLWSANPALIGDYAATYAILRDSARRLSDTRCGDPAGGPNNVYGNGRIDAFAAVARARVDVPWLSAPGTLAALPAGGSTTFTAHLDAGRVPGPGSYQARLQIYGADLSQPPTTVAITMQVGAAAQQASVSGRVIGAADGAPLQASVGVQGGQSVTTDASGAYTLTLAYGSYTLAASALSYLTASRAITLSGDLHLPDLILQPDQPHISIASTPLSATLAFAARRSIGVPIKNSGTRQLNYRVQVPPDQFGVWRSDEPGGPTYSWVDLPPDAASVSLGDSEFHDKIPLGLTFPFYSYSLTETLVASDGMLGFSPPFQYFGFTGGCLPAAELYFLVIAPFRSDLDPSRGGSVRYGTLAGGQTFVLSYENIPLHSGPAGETYTFQVLLHTDGRITFQYKQLAALPSQLSVGVQRTFSEFQQIGCGSALPLHDGLAIELRPQAPASDWLSSSISADTLAAGGQRQLVVTLKWARPSDIRVYRGRIMIASSDPLQPLITLPVQIDLRPAPYERWYPLIQRGL